MNNQIVRGTPYFPTVSDNISSYTPLEQDISSDVVIVGGGITGALCAYYFIKHNIKTVLIEKHTLCQGSTSITTSLLQYELDELIEDLEKNYQLSQIIQSYKFSKEGLKELKQLINDLKLDCDYINRDCILYTDDPKSVSKLKYEYEKRKENGFEVKFIDSSSTGFDTSFDIKAGVYAYNGGMELNPFKLTFELIKHFVKNGGEIFEHTEITGYEDRNVDVLLTTSQHTRITCKKVIVATGYDISTFTNQKYSSLYTTYNIVTSPIKNITGWPNHCLIKTADSNYYYLRTTPDHRIIIGGEDTRFIPELLENTLAERQYNKLHEKLKSLFPQLNFTIDFKYNGTFGTTPDNLPYIGPDIKHKNIWYCLGYGANGILFAVNGAKMLSKLYTGDFDELLRLVSLERN